MQTIVLWRDNPLRDLCQGTYVLNAAKKVNNSKFGKQYILSLGEEDNPSIGAKTHYHRRGRSRR
jgi:hypothetical protein